MLRATSVKQVVCQTHNFLTLTYSYSSSKRTLTPRLGRTVSIKTNLAKNQRQNSLIGRGDHWAVRLNQNMYKMYSTFKQQRHQCILFSKTQEEDTR